MPIRRADSPTVLLLGGSLELSPEWFEELWARRPDLHVLHADTAAARHHASLGSRSDDPRLTRLSLERRDPRDPRPLLPPTALRGRRLLAAVNLLTDLQPSPAGLRRVLGRAPGAETDAAHRAAKALRALTEFSALCVTHGAALLTVASTARVLVNQPVLALDLCRYGAVSPALFPGLSSALHFSRLSAAAMLSDQTDRHHLLLTPPLVGSPTLPVAGLDGLLVQLRAAARAAQTLPPLPGHLTLSVMSGLRFQDELLSHLLGVLDGSAPTFQALSGGPDLTLRRLAEAVTSPLHHPNLTPLLSDQATPLRVLRAGPERPGASDQAQTDRFRTLRGELDRLERLLPHLATFTETA
jgi:hypothetical protein